MEASVKLQDLWIAHVRTAMHVSVGWVISLMWLDDKGRVWSPGTGGRFLLMATTRVSYLLMRQCDHNDWRLTTKTSPGYPALLTRREVFFLYASTSSNKCMIVEEKVQTALYRTLQMLIFPIPPDSLFFGDGCLHYSGHERKGIDRVLYELYFIPETSTFGDAPYFLYTNSRGLWAEIQELTGMKWR